MVTAETPRRAGDEPLPGYRLVARLGSGGYGEVWKCTAPGGLLKAVKFVRSGADDPTRDGVALRQELGAFEKVKGIRHPFVLGLERVEVSGPDLVMVMELADSTLQDRYEECARAGFPGIPAGELLPLAYEAAEALDLLAGHGLQHLDVKPANLFLVGGHVKVGDFSLVTDLGRDRRDPDSLAGITPKYAPPEVLQGTPATASDQYSLALAVYELLTGRYPYTATSARALVLQHVGGTPDLSAVPPAQAAVFARALAKHPGERYPDCREFVRQLGLAAAGSGEIAPSDRPAIPARPGDTQTLTTDTLTRRPYPAPVGPTASGRFGYPTRPPSGVQSFPTRQLPPVPFGSENGLAPAMIFDEDGAAVPGSADPSLAAGVLALVRGRLLGAVDVSGEDGTGSADLFCRFPVRPDPAALAAQLKQFADGRRIALAPGKAGEYVLSVAPPTGWLRRLLDRPDPLRVAVTLPAADPSLTMGEVTVRARGCGGATDRDRYALAVEVLDGLRSALAAGVEHRRAVRYPVRLPVVIHPVDPMGGVEPGVEARTVDLSVGGARVETADPIPAEHFYLRFLDPPTAARCGILCSVVRRGERDGQFELGCRFRPV